MESLKMVNASTKIVGNILTITVDLSERHGLSESQKTICIAKLQGKLPGEHAKVTVGLNVYTKAG